MISTNHQNAAYYFKRDVDCIRECFRRRFNFESEEFPVFGDIERKHSLDVELAASGFTKKMNRDLLKVCLELLNKSNFLFQAYDEKNFNEHVEEEDETGDELDEELDEEELTPESGSEASELEESEPEQSTSKGAGDQTLKA